MPDGQLIRPPDSHNMATAWGGFKWLWKLPNRPRFPSFRGSRVATEVRSTWLTLRGQPPVTHFTRGGCMEQPPRVKWVTGGLTPRVSPSAAHFSRFATAPGHSTLASELKRSPPHAPVGADAARRGAAHLLPRTRVASASSRLSETSGSARPRPCGCASSHLTCFLCTWVRLSAPSKRTTLAGRDEPPLLPSGQANESK